MSLKLEDLDAKVLIGSSIPKEIEHDLIKFLKYRKKIVVWKHKDITGIDKKNYNSQTQYKSFFKAYKSKKNGVCTREKPNHPKGSWKPS